MGLKISDGTKNVLCFYQAVKLEVGLNKKPSQTDIQTKLVQHAPAAVQP